MNKWKANGNIVVDQSGNYISTAVSDAAAKLFADAHNAALKTERERIRELERITSATGREAKLVEALVRAEAGNITKNEIAAILASAFTP